MPKDREDFLIEMYRSFWENVTRSERNMWQMISFYIAIITAIFIAMKGEHLDIFGGSLILILFSYWTIYITLTAHLWICRNMGLISNIEKEFLKKNDYGKIFPTSFKRKLTLFRHPLAYFYICEGLILLTALIAAGNGVIQVGKVECMTWKCIIIILSWILGFLIAIIQLKHHLRKHKEFIEEAPGKELDGKSEA